jgi:hypothetical protein
MIAICLYTYYNHLCQRILIHFMQQRHTISKHWRAMFFITPSLNLLFVWCNWETKITISKLRDAITLCITLPSFDRLLRHTVAYLIIPHFVFASRYFIFQYTSLLYCITFLPYSVKPSRHFSSSRTTFLRHTIMLSFASVYHLASHVQWN